MKNQVYLLWFIPDREAKEDDALLVGVYKSEGMARAAIERLKNKPGFADHPDGFEIHTRELDRDYWTEGFVRR